MRWGVKWIFHIFVDITGLEVTSVYSNISSGFCQAYLIMLKVLQSDGSTIAQIVEL